MPFDLHILSICLPTVFRHLDCKDRAKFFRFHMWANLCKILNLFLYFCDYSMKNILNFSQLDRSKNFSFQVAGEGKAGDALVPNDSFGVETINLFAPDTLDSVQGIPYSMLLVLLR